MDEAVVFGALAGVSVGLVRVVERLVDFVTARRQSRKDGHDRDGNGGCALTKGHAEKIGILYEQHQRFDEDGAPLWYMPRSFVDGQRETARLLARTAADQKRTAECLSRIEAKMDKIEDKVDRLAVKDA